MVQCQILYVGWWGRKLLPECVGSDSHGKILSAPDEQLVISFNWGGGNKQTNKQNKGTLWWQIL